MLANYLERSLLPLRFVCYTQTDLLKRPIERNTINVEKCIHGYFSGRNPPLNCLAQSRSRILIDINIPDAFRDIVVVRNAGTERGYRDFIRKTWKNNFTALKIPVIFLSGTANDPQVATADKFTVGSNKYLQEESLEFGDVVQLDFRESYSNLTLKMINAYNYLLNKFPKLEQIIAINDDTIANVTALYQIPMKNGSWMTGKVSRGYPRLFFWWLKWYIPAKMYPNWCYPTFVQGSSFIITRKAAEVIANNICQFPSLNLDDVLMGIVCDCLNISLQHYEGFDKNVPEDFVVFHYQYIRYTPSQMLDIWNSTKL